MSTKEFEAACNGEIDMLGANEVGEDILEELDDWSELGWILLECGCLVNPVGLRCHGPAQQHLEKLRRRLQTAEPTSDEEQKSSTLSEQVVGEPGSRLSKA